MPRKVNQHIDLIGCDLFGRRLIAQSIEPPPNVCPFAQLASQVIGWARGFVSINPHGICRPVTPDRRQQAANRMTAEIAREKSHTDGALIGTARASILRRNSGGNRRRMPLGPPLVLLLQAAWGSDRIIMQRQQQIAVRRHRLRMHAQGRLEVSDGLSDLA
jgi:hypothetical protein